MLSTRTQPKSGEAFLQRVVRGSQSPVREVKVVDIFVRCADSFTESCRRGSITMTHTYAHMETQMQTHTPCAGMTLCTPMCARSRLGAQIVRATSLCSCVPFFSRGAPRQHFAMCGICVAVLRPANNTCSKQ